MEKSSDSSTPQVAGPLIERCQTLLEEICALQETIREHDHLPKIECRAFRSNVQSELRFLQNIGSEAEERTQHAIRSSNLGYFELVWAAAKASTGLKWILPQVHETGFRPSVRQEKGVKTIQVEVIAEDGMQWIKLNAISPKRLMYELAKSGWEGDMDDADFGDEDEGDVGGGGGDDSNEDRDWNNAALSNIPLIQQADLLARAAKNTWVNYKHPKILYLFQNIHLTTATTPIKQIFRRLEKTGAEIVCIDNPKPTFPLGIPAPTIEEAIQNIRERDPYGRFSETLNIDCTILLALISDISNLALSPTDPPPILSRYHPAILSQLENELTRPLLPTTVYPALRNHSLICTPCARARFEEIVETIGTSSERKRASLLMGTTFTPLPPATLLTEFRALTTHPVPDGLLLPIRTLPEHDEHFDAPEKYGDDGRSLAGKLSKINRSVFMTGWRSGLTTITSNMAVGKQLESAWTEILGGLEKQGKLGEAELEDWAGPEMWIINTARSLVGKGPPVPSRSELSAKPTPSSTSG